MIAHAAGQTSGVAAVPRFELTGVARALGGVPAVIDLSQMDSPNNALFGENGAGKSTLKNLVSCVLAPDGAEIRLYGVRGGMSAPPRLHAA
jgi:ABC-type sugar transport system ATPase subunit